MSMHDQSHVKASFKLCPTHVTAFWFMWKISQLLFLSHGVCA